MRKGVAAAVALVLGASCRSTPVLSRAEAERIGHRLWQNECAGTVAGLTSWNEGETFASLGIGHFIWYPAGQDGPFEEGFPPLVAYLQEAGVACPAWIRPPADCPWPDRAAFLAARESPRMRALRRLLADTVGLQAQFAAERLRRALPELLASIPRRRRPALRRTFDAVAAHPHGLYALVDYVNFKGEGTKPTERYRGQGWGLLQVLQSMRPAAPGAPALAAFSDAAIEVLTRRVQNAPPERNEQRWLPGWITRCRTYRAPALEQG